MEKSMKTQINASNNQVSVTIETPMNDGAKLNPTTVFPSISVEEAKALVFNTKEKNFYANRRIVLSKVNELMNSLCTPLSLKLMSPIVINTRNQHVIDGQHRIIAILRLVDEGRLSSDVRINAFMDNLTDEEELNVLMEKNSKSHNWCETDYIALEIYNGNENILKMQKFANQFPSLCINSKKRISWRATSYVLDYKLPKKQDTYFAKQEYYEQNPLTDEMFTDGEKFAKEIIRIHELLNFPLDINNVRAITLSWREVRNQYSNKVWMYKFKMYAKHHKQEMKKTLDTPTLINSWKTLFRLVKCED